MVAKNIVLITSGQPSLNPRLVKEADALVEAGFAVTVICQYWSAMGTMLDNSLLPGKEWHVVTAGGDPVGAKALYWFTRLRHKMAVTLSKAVGFRFGLLESSLGRVTGLLGKAAANQPAVLYIAHNLGALPAAVYAARKNNAKCGFDAEDFHRCEITNDQHAYPFRLAAAAEEKYFKYINYFSTSAPLITKQYRRLFPHLAPLTIRNVFPRQEPGQPQASRQGISLLWLSQTIGQGRGIEEVLAAAVLCSSVEVHLHLLGRCGDFMLEYLTRKARDSGFDPSRLHLHKPVPSKQVTPFASQFDVGLAAETGFPQNRDLCLTNKLFTYIQAGLAVIASDTAGQKQLLDDFPGTGLIYRKNDPVSLAGAIGRYAEDKQLLLETKKMNYNLGQNTLNWESEQTIFLDTVNRILR